jgi:hypothetical protein
MKNLLLILTALMLPLTAAAHGPSSQKVEQDIVIKADPAKVWAILKDFSSIGKWHPAVASVKMESKKDENGDDATYRLLTLKDGGTILEKLKSADDSGMQLKYEIEQGVLPVNDYYAVLTVKAGPGAGESTVTWMARFYRKYMLNPPIPPGQDDESAVKAVTGVVEAGLAGLKSLAESK